jgi:hypothetical protein
MSLGIASELRDEMSASSTRTPESTVPWSDPRWLEDVAIWAGTHVKLTGEIDAKRGHMTPWSVVARVPTVEGRMWLKELGPGLAFEPALTQALARLRPDRVPEVVAVDGARILMRDAGPRLGGLDDRPLSAWAEVLARYADLQIELSGHGVELPAPDSRPGTLARRFGDRVHRLVAEVGNAIPATLAHLNLNRGNVAGGNADPVFLDWGGAAIAHPFCSLAKPLEILALHHGVAPGGREAARVSDAYLEPWSTVAPLRELHRIFAAAYPLGALCRALIWERKLAPLGPAVSSRYEHKIVQKLEAFAAAMQTAELL